MTPSANTFDGLQKIRAFAAILVVIDHSLETAVRYGALTENYLPIAYVFGNIGVKVFFALSGFIMAHTTQDTIPSWTNLLDFLLKRIIRVAPLYWIATTIYVMRLTAGGDQRTIESIFKSLLFIPYKEDGTRFAPIYGVGWTLNYEMYFYCIFAISLLAPIAWRRAIVFLVIGGSLAAGFLARSNGVQLGDLWTFYTDVVLVYFLLGMVVWLFWQRVPGSLRIPAVAISVAASAVAVSTASNHYGAWWFEPLYIVATISALVFGILSPARTSKYTLALGDASYSIYLTHSFVVGPLAWFAFSGLAGVWPAWAYIAVVSVVACVIGALVHRGVEAPMLRALRSRLVSRS